MKKLLLLTNIVCVSFSLASCKNAKQSKSETIVSDSKQTIKDSVFATDTTKILNQTPVSGTVGIDNGIKKDTTKKIVNTNAIIHNAPEQEKIDSIKKAKQKF